MMDVNILGERDGMRFCTVVTCMDGRIQKPVMQFLSRQYGYELPDTITDPGPIKALSDPEDKAYFERICQRIDISVNKHGSRHIFLVGHDDCAGNPTGRSVQEDQEHRIVPRLQQRYPDCQVTALYVDDNCNCAII